MSSKTENRVSHPWRDAALPLLTGGFMLAALIMIFFVVPNEKVQGPTQRIFYFHIHLAWMAFGGLTTVDDIYIEKDASVFPAGRAHGGMPLYNKAIPSILHYNGAKLKEFPINTHNIFGMPIIFSGGGYFRLFPYGINEVAVITLLAPSGFGILIPGISSNKFMVKSLLF